MPFVRNEFAVNDLVLLYRAGALAKDGKLAPSYSGPFIVSAIVFPNVYRLKTPDGDELKKLFSGSKLKLYRPRPPIIENRGGICGGVLPISEK